jgi:hypothetical protein
MRLIVPDQFVSFLEAAVDGRAAWPDPRVHEPMHSENWWTSKTPGYLDEVATEWKELDRRGRLAETTVWLAQLSSMEKVSRIFTDKLTRFQCTNTLLEPGDTVPLPWSSVSWKAAAGLYNIGWTGRAMRLRDSRPEVSDVYETVLEWLDSQDASANWADALLVSSFRDVLKQWIADSNGDVRECEARLDDAQVLAKNAKPPAKVASALAVKRAEEELQLAKNVRQFYSDSSEKVAVLDPLHSLLPVNSQVTVLLRDPTSFGVSTWFARALVKSLRKPGQDLFAGLGTYGAMWPRSVANLLLHMAKPDDASWRLASWLARFYEIWFNNAWPKAGRPSPQPSDSDQAHGNMESFFRPWFVIFKARRVIENDPLMRFGSALRFLNDSFWMSEQSAMDLNRFAREITIGGRGPITPRDYQDFHQRRLSYFTESLLVIGEDEPVDTEEAHVRRMELIEMYSLWAECTAGEDVVRQAVPNPQRVQQVFVVFFATWFGLERAYHLLQQRSTRNDEFGAAFRPVEEQFGEKIRGLANYLRVVRGVVSQEQV